MAGGMRGSLSPMRANGEIIDIVCKFDIGASGAHTKVYGNGMSVARDSAGKYTVTFTEWGPVLIGFSVQHWAQADAEPLIARPTDGSFSYTASAATVAYETWDLDTTAQTELPSGDSVTITARFQKSA